MKLNASKLGSAAGILWGACLLVITLFSLWSGYAQDFLYLLSSIYPGYDISLGGAFIGAIYGFLDGFIGLWLFAKIYNWLLER